MKVLNELADFFIGFNINEKPKIAIRGGTNKLTQNGGTDRVKPPHFHIYDSSNGSISFEVDLQRLLCLDIIYFVFYKDNKTKKSISNEEQIVFQKQAKTIYEIMQLKPNVKKPEYLKGCCNNVEAAIRIFNRDADLESTAGINVPQDEKLLAILSEKSDTMKIKPKYNKCFEHIPKEIRDKYKDCFEEPF